MAELKPIQFTPSKSIADSPLTENAFSQCVDTTTVGGIARINFKMANVIKDTSESATLKDFVKILNDRALDSDGNFWEYDSAGINWDLLSAGVLNGQTGRDFIEWQDYAFMLRNGHLSVYGLITDTTTEVFKAEQGSVIMLGQDNTIYIGYNNIIRSIQADTGDFDPTSGATYIYTADALDLPDGEVIKAINELGAYISIGTESGKVYLWDRAGTTFELPAQVPKSVEMLIAVNNNNYIVNSDGDIFITNGSTTELVKKFPRHILDRKDSPNFVFKPNAYRLENDLIFIGYGSTTTTSPMGVYSLNFKNGEFKLEHISSTEAVGGSAADQMQITAIQNIGNFSISWKRGEGSGVDPYTYGADRLHASRRYRDELAQVVSPFYIVGTLYNKRTFKHTEILLSERLTTSNDVTLYYRESLETNWVEIGKFDEVNKDRAIIDKSITVDKIQLKATMDTAILSGTDKTPNLVSVTMY
jgi:hypothetical protein